VEKLEENNLLHGGERGRDRGVVAVNESWVFRKVTDKKALYFRRGKPQFLIPRKGLRTELLCATEMVRNIS